VALGDGVRLTFRAKTRRFCCSSSGVEDKGGRTGREKLDTVGPIMGILPARLYPVVSTRSFGDDTTSVGTGALDENDEDSCCK
jgi:hypothetical protein